jgi:adenylyl-sulfate kinase
MTNIIKQDYKVNREQREAVKQQKAKVFWLTGLSGSGKSTLANGLHTMLNKQGFHSYVLDGDNMRLGLNNDLDFSIEGRTENIRRIAEVAKLFVDAGLVVVTAFISPFIAERQRAREIIGESDFYEIYVDADVALCESRDVKGLYKKARKGEIKNFTGIDSPYEHPKYPDFIIDTRNNLEECIAELSAFVNEKIKP